MVLANQEFLLAFIVRRNNWRKILALIVKNNEEQEQKFEKIEEEEREENQKIVELEMIKRLKKKYEN